MTTKRPGGLTAVAVIAIVLGILGGCGGLVGMASLFAQSTLEDTQRRMLESSGMPPDQVEAQLAAQTEVNAIQRKWMPFTVSQQIVNVVACTLLLVAGIMLLRGSRAAPKLFVAAVVLNVVVDIAGGVIGVLVQQDMQSAMSTMMGSAAAGAGNPQMDRMFEGILRASTWTGLCFAILWVAAKLGYYVWGVIYLRKPAVRALFAPA